MLDVVMCLGIRGFSAHSCAPPSRVQLPAPETSPASPPESSGTLEQLVQAPAGPIPTPEHTGIKATFKGLLEDFENLPSRQNLFVASAPPARSPCILQKRM